jgi:hypothetical protein
MTPLPNDFASSTLAIASDWAGQYAPLVETIAGVFIAVLAVVIIIRAFSRH